MEYAKLKIMEDFKPLRWIFLSILPLLIFLSLPFLFSSTQVYAQGTYDCQWRDIAGRNACRAVNINCDEFYTHDSERCGQLTDDGREVCERDENQNIECEPEQCPSGDECVVVETTDQCAGTARSCTGDRGTGNCCRPAQTECESQYGGECLRGGTVKTVCQDGYDTTPVGGYGELGCSSLEHCCVPLSSGCHTWNPVTGCQDGAARCANDQTTCCSDVTDCPVFNVRSPTGIGGCDGNELYTAIGCIPIGDADDFLGFILSWALGLAGGIAFLMIIYSGFQIVTSAGDPGKVKSGKELLTAAIGGLLLILFSVFILDLIGVDILQIPGFGG